MSEQLPSALPSGEPPRWKAIHAWTMNALAEMIAKAEDTVALTIVTPRSIEIPSKPWLAVNTDVKPPPGGWRAQQFFLVDADTRNASKPKKIRVETRYPPKAQRLVFDLTPAVRRSLGNTTQVRVGYTDNLELDLLRHLQAQLKESASQAPKVEDLWSGKALSKRLEQLPAGFNENQARALRAMLSGGGWLLWGPPGTGKTTVIVGAVREALRRGWSVLIASHTHVAVDNVVKDVAAQVADAGIVVRVGNENKVDPELAVHPWLLLDKAAAVITRLEERTLELDDARRANVGHPDRDRLVAISRSLAELDEARYHQAVQALAAQEKHRLVVADITAREALVTRQRHHRDNLQASAEVFAAQAFPLTAMIEDQRAARNAAMSARQRLKQVQQEIDQREAELSAAEEAAATADTDAARWTAKLPWARKAHEARVGRSAERVRTITIELGRLSATVPDLASAVERHTAEEQRLDPLVAACQDADSRWARCNNDHQRAVERLSGMERQLTEVKAEELRHRQVTGSVPDPDRIVAEALAADVPALVAERDALNDAVAALDVRYTALVTATAQLADLYRDTKKTLLEQAPVIACTLSSLTTKTELANRRFDLVIIDEAASASIPQLMFAGSKAGRSLAFVGDFLQNEPIVDVARRGHRPAAGAPPLAG